jgi:cytochrome c553
MKKTATILLFISVFIGIISSCNQNSASDTTTGNKAEMEQGYALINTYCVSCHTPAGNADNRIAPPFIAIKKHYINNKTSYQEFETAIAAYINNPTKENSKMPGAVKRFGVMPKLELKAEDVSKIATYIYYTELESPEWFKKHYEQEHGSAQNTISDQSKLEIGQKMAMQTKGVLGKNLLNAIANLGPDGAVSFCNTRAISLTDSMATELHANIRRISDQPRNPQNRASDAYLSKIQSYKQQLSRGEDLKGDSVLSNGKSYYIYPIVTNAMCLKCHGDTKKDIAPKTLAKINVLYKMDEATGYTENQLRGIWVVDFD